MLAFAFIPCAPRIARADGPIIDADVQRLMDEKPDEGHALIVSVELCRTPQNLEELLPTPEQTNECTRLWRAWETLVEEFEEGCNENLTQDMVDAAYAEAKTYDEVIVSIQKAAYKTYHEDYAKIVEESVPDVYESLRSALGDRVRRVSESSKLLAVRADRAAFETIRETASIKRVSFDIEMGPMLDKSRKNILADQVHCSTTSAPYTGEGVKVAIVDDGITYDHPRLPTPSAADEKDFSTNNEECEFPGNTCTLSSHGTQVAGVIFCLPDANPCGTGSDGFVGIAYEATLVNAKVSSGSGGGDQGLCNYYQGNCPPSGCDGEYEAETWSRTIPAFEWAVAETTGPAASVLNYSRGNAFFDPDNTDTLRDHVSALNVDWLVHTSGASFVHSCGNHGEPEEGEDGDLGVPSGAYNLVSVANYDDHDSEDRADATMASTSSWGWTDDHRRKPDVSAPGTGIHTTRWRYDCEEYFPPPCEGCEDVYELADFGGTSAAAPHVAGVAALLKEARPSLTPAQVHAILINSTTFMDDLNQVDWHRQAGWGMLHALDAVLQRNFIQDGSLAGDGDVEVFDLSSIPAGGLVVITGVWNRAMYDEDTPVADGNSNPSPANIDLILQDRAGGGDWQDVDTTVGTYDGNDDLPEDNARQVRGAQATSPPYREFRVRVRLNTKPDVPFDGTQSFTIASRHAFQ